MTKQALVNGLMGYLLLIVTSFSVIVQAEEGELADFKFVEEPGYLKQAEENAGQVASLSNLTAGATLGYLEHSNNNRLTAHKINNAWHKSYAYRKLVKVNNDGSYLIQDFYLDSQDKYTDPYKVKSKLGLLDTSYRYVVGEITFYRKPKPRKYSWLKYFTENFKEKSYSMKEGNKEGLYSWWDEQGNLAMQGHYQADKKQGVWIIYDEEGYKMQGMMENDLQQGGWLTLNQDGHKIAEYSYKNNKLDGLFTRWHPYELTKEQQGNYYLGKRQGQWLSWYTDGLLIEQSNYHEGYQNGSFKAWDPLGRLTKEGSYNMGQKIGLWTEYYYQNDNSMTYRENLYLLNGGEVSRSYYPDGLLFVEDYKKNKESDRSYWIWYDSGRLQERRFSKQGKSEGEHTKWNREGKIIWQGVFKDGKKISEEGNYYGY